MKKVRAKFTCNAVQGESIGLGGQVAVENANEMVYMTAVTDTGIPEDQKFSQYTPYGTLNFGISNPALIGQFKQGKSYYIDITEVPEAETPQEND